MVGSISAQVALVREADLARSARRTHDAPRVGPSLLRRLLARGRRGGVGSSALDGLPRHQHALRRSHGPARGARRRVA